VGSVAPQLPAHCDLIPVQAADALAEGPRYPSAVPNFWMKVTRHIHWKEVGLRRAAASKGLYSCRAAE